MPWQSISTHAWLRVQNSTLFPRANFLYPFPLVFYKEELGSIVHKIGIFFTCFRSTLPPPSSILPDLTALPFLLAKDWQGSPWFLVSMVYFFLYINISDGFDYAFLALWISWLFLRAIMWQGLCGYFYALVLILFHSKHMFSPILFHFPANN